MLRMSQNDAHYGEDGGVAVDIAQDGGDLVANLQDYDWNPWLMRPYFDPKRPQLGALVTIPKTDPYTGTIVTTNKKDEKGEVVTNAQGEPITSPVFEIQRVADRLSRGLPAPAQCLTANATLLPKDVWIRIDRNVAEAVRKKLLVWDDLKRRQPMGGFDGMAFTLMQWERATAQGEAHMDMDGLTQGRTSQGQFDLLQQPLPITHSDFHLPKRFMQIDNRGGGMTVQGRREKDAGRAVGEMIENTCLGIDTTPFQYGATTGIAGTVSKVYGYMNHPDIQTKTDMTAPTAGGWTPETTYNEVLAVLELLALQEFYGPFTVYVSTDWDQYLDRVFAPSGGNNPSETLRTMLLKNPSIGEIKRVPTLNATDYTFTMLFVDMTDEEGTAAVNGMEVVTVQWESMGGFRQNFKVLGIQVPLIRSRYVGTGSSTKYSPVLKATTS